MVNCVPNAMASRFKLTDGALQIIMNGGNVVDPIMQVLGSKKLNSTTSDKARYRIMLSDGKHSISFAMFSTQINDKIGTEAIQTYSIIKMKRYITNMIDVAGIKDTRIVLILDLDLLAKGSDVGESIGSPISLSGSDLANTQVTSNEIRSIPSCSKFNQGVISPIASLCPYHNNWVIKARVVNKSNVRHWSNSNGEGKFFILNFIDDSGEMRCTAFTDMVDKFYDFIEVDKVYNVSKGLLKLANKQYNDSDAFYEMTLTPESVVEESLEDNDSVPQMKYNFTSIDKISVMEAGTVVDVLGVCRAVSDLKEFLSKSSNRELKKKEVTLVDQSQTAIAFTLWDAQAENFNVTDNPVILIKGAKISEFGGTKNLSIRMTTLIKLNPDIAASHQLRAWYDIGGHQLEFKNVSLRDGFGALNTAWMTLKEVQQQQLGLSDPACYFQTFATILVVRSDRATYKACPSENCHKKVVDLENGMYRCEKCNREYPNFKYRFLVMANVADSSSSQWVTLFSSEAEKILGRTAAELGPIIETDQDAAIKIFEEAQFSQFVFKCRAKLESYNDEERLRVTVVKVDSVNHDYHSYLMQKIESCCETEGQE